MAFDYAVFIGRFQPFHNGHLGVVRHALEEANHLIIVLGSANLAPSIKNPFTVDQRKMMIREALSKAENERVSFVNVGDYFYSDLKWINDVYVEVENITKGKKTALVGYHKDHTTYYLDLFPQWKFIHVPPVQLIDATTVRQLLFEEKGYTHMLPAGVNDFLDIYKDMDVFGEMQKEFFAVRDYQRAWAGTPYPPVFVTVDAVVLQGGRVLVVKRKDYPGKGLFALPGGFVQPHETLRDAMIRELYEETSLVVPREQVLESIVSSTVFDNPGRSTRGRTITHAYFIHLSNKLAPHVTGADDAEHALWMSIPDIYKRQCEFFEDHTQIITHFTERAS